MYYNIDIAKTLQESLSNTTIIEYPTLILLTRDEFDADKYPLYISATIEVDTSAIDSSTVDRDDESPLMVYISN